MVELSYAESLLVLLIYVHIAATSYSIYAHRFLTHKSIKLSPTTQFVFYRLLWLLFGVFGEDGVALHKKHHAYADRNGDQLSPKIHGKYNMLVKKPLQRISLKLTQPTHYGFGGLVFLAMNTVLFGMQGTFLYVAFVIVSVISQQVILDGAGHLIGYRNYSTKDNSKNIFPIAIIFGGEELHNNHHAEPSSAKYSKRWFEFDIGFFYIKILEFLRLAEINRI